MKQFEEAEAAFREGIALLSRIGKALPDLPATTLTSELAKCHRGLGETLAECQRHQEVIDALRQAAKLREQLPNKFGFRMALANDYRVLCLSFQQLDRLEDVLRATRQRLAVWEGIAADFPNAVEHYKGRSGSHAHLGHLLRKAGEIQEAATHYRKALELFEKLAGDCPDEPEYCRGLEDMRKSLAGLPKTKQAAPESPSM